MTKFKKDIKRDVILLRASLRGGLDAVRAAAMLMPEFAGGPDTVTDYSIWISAPRRQAYRAAVAAAMKEPHG